MKHQLTLSKDELKVAINEYLSANCDMEVEISDEIYGLLNGSEPSLLDELQVNYET